MIRSKGRGRREFLQGLAAAGACVAADGLLAGCGHRVVQRVALAPGNADSLGVHAAAHGLLVGFAVNTGMLKGDARYAQVVREQATIIVAENAMKFWAMRPTENAYKFDEADALVAFGEENKIKVRGHNLVWHQMPEWFGRMATKENARRLMVEHIETVASRYAGRIHSWDVVNEAVLLSDNRADGLRASQWLRLVGEDYIEVAFRAARAADPLALLTYNEYGIEGDNPADEQKRQAVLMMLRRLKARDVPVDALGIQSHIGSRWSYGVGLKRLIAEAEGLGLQVFLTEMDVNDSVLGRDASLRDAEVAAAARKYLDGALSEPGVKAVLMWGVQDAQTWLNYGKFARADHAPQRSLLFDDEFRPKPAYFAVRDAIDRRDASARRVTRGKL